MLEAGKKSDRKTSAMTAKKTRIMYIEDKSEADEYWRDIHGQGEAR